MIIDTSNLNEARKLIEKISKQKKRVVVLAKDDEFNRKILENNKVDVLLNPGFNGRDKLKQRDSELNEVLCKIATKNKVRIGITFQNIIKTKGKERAVLLSRLIQNINLCKKTGTDIEFFGKYDKKDLSSLLLTLGASTQQAKKVIM